MKKVILILAVIVITIFGYLIYFQKNGDVITEPPTIVILDDFYASSTNELVVIWSIENIAYVPPTNTGIRYDSTSHATTTPTSEIYEFVKLPAEINEDNNFELRIDFENFEELFFRVQASVPGSEGFLWSNEKSVKKIILENKETDQEESV